MKEIEGLETTIKELSNYWPQIENHFNIENEKYKQLLLHDHQQIGRILKCHLILESYIDNFILEHYEIDNLKDLRLSFYQKTQMLPAKKSSAAIVKPGIIQINQIRNMFSHNLTASIEKSNMSAIYTLLEVARKGCTFQNHVDAIEAFTTVACTWLMTTPPELADVFEKAFSKISVTRLDDEEL